MNDIIYTAYDLAEKGQDSSEIAFTLMVDFGLDSAAAKYIAEKAVADTCFVDELFWGKMVTPL